MRTLIGLMAMVCLSGIVRAQAPAQAGMERVIVVAPMVGAGTVEDPRRPLGMPAAGLPAGVESFSYVLSDDGKFAIVHLTSRARLTLSGLAAAVVALPQGREVRTFTPHTDSKDDVERALKLLKKDLQLDQLLGVGR